MQAYPRLRCNFTVPQQVIAVCRMQVLSFGLHRCTSKLVILAIGRQRPLESSAPAGDHPPSSVPRAVAAVDPDGRDKQAPVFTAESAQPEMARRPVRRPRSYTSHPRPDRGWRPTGGRGRSDWPSRSRRGHYRG